MLLLDLLDLIILLRGKKKNKIILKEQKEGAVDALGEKDKLKQNKILSILSHFRYLFKDISLNENIILQKLNVMESYRYMVFPCDVIDLRNVLLYNKIEFFEYVPLFSQKFAENVLKKYPLFLILDINKIDEEKEQFGGLFLIKNKEINIKKSLIRIIINEPTYPNVVDTVNNLLKEFDRKIECVVSNSIPIISTDHSKLSGGIS